MLIWEVLPAKVKDAGFLSTVSPGVTLRAAVPGGWLIKAAAVGGMTFLPDPHHEWTGDSQQVLAQSAAARSEER